MFGKLAVTLLTGTLATAAAALSLGVATSSNAQPYYGEPGYYDEPAQAGEIIVRPERWPGRTYNGIPTERVYASRVVDVSDLDLNTPWGAHVLYRRVERAAADACDELNMQWTHGLYPIDQDADCKARAVRHAMRAAPIGAAVDADYYGY